MKFKDLVYLLSGDYDLIDNETTSIGATLCLYKVKGFTNNGKIVFDSDFKLTDYGVEKFNIVLNSEIVIIENNAIMLNCKWEYINEFLNACSGNINCNEFDKIFNIDKVGV